MCEWYHFVIQSQFVIAGIETNPGPRKKRQSITKRAYNEKKKKSIKENKNSTDNESKKQQSAKKRKQINEDFHVSKITFKKAKFYDDETGTLKTPQMANETNAEIKRKDNLQQNWKTKNFAYNLRERNKDDEHTRQKKCENLKKKSQTPKALLKNCEINKAEGQNAYNLRKRRKRKEGDIQIGNKLRKRRERNKMSIDKRESIKQTDLQNKTEKRLHMTPKEREEITNMETLIRRIKRKTFSPEQLRNQNLRETESRRNARKTTSPRPRKEINSRETQTRKSSRDKLSEKKKQIIKAIETKGKRVLRDKLSIEQKMARNTKETKGIKATRDKLSNEQKMTKNAKYSKGKRVLREKLSLEKKVEIKIKQRLQKKQAKQKRKEQNTIKNIKDKFEKSIKDGPVYICTSCNRLLYRKSVKRFLIKNYQHCLKSTLKLCRTECGSIDGIEYIFITCDKSLRLGKIPPQSIGNALALDDIPEELQELCPLEERIVSKRLPFMQIVNLPRGGQKGIKGCVVNVPSNISSITNILPRLPPNCGLVPVKLKRGLKYKGHSMYQAIRPENVMKALKCLKEINKDYQDIKVDEDWILHCKDRNEELFKRIFEDVPEWENLEPSDESDSNNSLMPDAENEKDQNTAHSDENASLNKLKDQDNTNDTDDDAEDDNLRGLPFNTCLQPHNDPNINKYQDIFNIAPGEGQIPLDMIFDKSSEILAFPRAFPTGKFGLQHLNRPTNIYPKRYFNQRLLNKDTRFASNIEYIFFAQYYTEVKQIRDNISIALRKGSNSEVKKTAGDLKNPENIKKILNQNEGFSFLQSIRGSYPYWCKTLHDLFAMVRQLDIPTFFCTFSAADLRWPETI